MVVRQTDLLCADFECPASLHFGESFAAEVEGTGDQRRAWRAADGLGERLWAGDGKSWGEGRGELLNFPGVHGAGGFQRDAVHAGGKGE